MLKINKTDLIIEAYNLYKSGFDWIVRSQEDIDYIKENTEQNETILPVEEIFFKHFSLTETINKPKRLVLNQGEILEYLNINSILKPNKYELKEVLIKNKVTYKAYKTYGTVKKGIEVFVQPDYHFQKNILENEKPPF